MYLSPLTLSSYHYIILHAFHAKRDLEDQILLRSKARRIKQLTARRNILEILPQQLNAPSPVHVPDDTLDSKQTMRGNDGERMAKVQSREPPVSLACLRLHSHGDGTHQDSGIYAV